MPTTTRTASVTSCDGMHFANFVLKHWLYSIGPARRVEVLKKLRIGLQSLRLSRRQVHYALVQLLASRTCVILVREPFHKRQGSKIPKEEIEEIEIFDSDSSFVEERSQEKYEDVPKLDTPKFIGKGHDQRIDGMNVYEVLSSNSNRDYIFHKSEKSPAIMHPFEEALMQFESVVPTKMNRKSCSKRKSSATVSLDIKKRSCEHANHVTVIENKSSISEETVPNEALAKVEINTIQMADEVKKGRIKLNLNSCYSNKSSNYVKSEAYKKVDSTKLDDDKELRVVNINVNSAANRNKYSKYRRNEYVLAGTEATAFEYDALTTLDRKQRKRRSVSQNTNRHRRRRISSKFRTYFGDCITISEDEQERDILKTTYKRRKKLVSINSCDSGVSVTNENGIVVDVQVYKDIQIAIPESTMNDTSSETENSVTIDGPKENILAHSVMNATIENTNIHDESEEENNRETVIKVHSSMAETSDENTFKKTIVHFNECNKSNEIVEDKNNEIQNEAQARTQKSIDLIDEGICLSDFSKPPQVTERLVISVPISETEAEENGTTLCLDMPDISTSDDELVINEDAFDVHESTVDTTGLNKHDHVDIIESCEVPSEKDLHKIKEDVIKSLTDETVGENLNSTNTSEVKTELIVADEMTGENLKSINTPEVKTELIVADEMTSENVNSTNTPEVKTEVIVADEVTSENLNSTNTPEVQTEIQDSEEEVPLISTGGNDADTNFVPSSITNQEIEFISVNSVECTSNDEPAVEETTELNDTSVEKTSQLDQVPQPKLRILSSAELGSRWCPTPMNPVTTVVQFSSAMTSQDLPIYITSVGTSATQTVHATSMITVPVSATTAKATFSNNTNTDVVKLSTSVYSVLCGIYHLIKNIRTTPTNDFNYDKYLCTEFQKLLKKLNLDNYIALIKAVILVLNRETSLSPPLSLTELLGYSSLLNKLYIRNSRKLRLDGRPTDQEISLQGVHYNEQIENTVTSVESMLQYLWSTHKKYMKYTAYSKGTRQNLQDNVNLQTQTNFQNNTSMNPIVANNQVTPNVSAVRTQNPIIQEQIRLNSHVAQPLTNFHVRQQLSHPSMGMHEQRKLHASTVPASNLRFPHQNVLPTVTQSIPQINLQNVPKTVSQNIPKTTPQDVSQSTLQNVSLTAFQRFTQTAFQKFTQTTLQNVPQTSLQNVPQTALQNVPQSTLQNVSQISLQNVPQSTLQNVSQTTLQNVSQISLQNVPQSTLQNVSQTTLQNVSQISLQNVPQSTLQNVSQTTYQNVSQTSLQNVSQITNVPQNIPQRYSLYNAGRIPRYPVPQNMQPAHINVQKACGSTVNQPYQYVRQPPMYHPSMYRQSPSAYNMSQGAHLQNSPQNTQNYIPKPVRDLNTGNANASQLAPSTMSQSEQVLANAVTTRTTQNYTINKYVSAQHAQNVRQSRMTNPTALTTQTQNPQMSLESMTNMFGILKYLTDIQKLVLIEQIEYYFRCTSWLQQEFTPQQWHLINMQRNLLLQFQRLLKCLVEKSVKQLLPEKCEENAIETNVVTNILIEVPKILKITVKENDGMQCQVEVPQTKQEATNNNQHNLDIAVTQSQLEERNEVVDMSQNKGVSNETEVRNSKIFDKNVLEENIPSQSNIQDPTLNSNHQRHEAERESTNFENTEVQNLERSSKNNLQQSSPHLVTVEVGPDKVTVIDTNNIDIDKPGTEKDKEIENDVQVARTLESPNERLRKDEEIKNEDIQVASTLVSPNKRLRKDEEINNEDVQVVNTLEFQNKRLRKDEEIRKEEVQITNVLESPNKNLKREDQDIENVASTSESANDEVIYLKECSSDFEYINTVVVDDDDVSSEESAGCKITDIRSISEEIFNVNVDEEIKECLRCRKPSTVLCGNCLVARYCSEKCSTRHWKYHFKDCNSVDRNYSY
ncbi:uncharacterized protein LOC113464524 isoform X2 [Ceratina calcarata]|uniref:Uncharacterized protein LOC113464524 isoform X2 n=1 Tax=Ceratina calcarata TaxID=156304 RepID=A0AAJ7S379_9HYME|nr:uncharacterized protein LOC113464524 isoform X2 [Ceratina calcarata]